MNETVEVLRELKGYVVDKIHENKQAADSLHGEGLVEAGLVRDGQVLGGTQIYYWLVEKIKELEK